MQPAFIISKCYLENQILNWLYLLLCVVWKKTIRQHVNLFLSHTPQKQHFRPFSVPLLEATLQFNFMLLLLSLPGENHFRDRKNTKHCISLSFLTFSNMFLDPSIFFPIWIIKVSKSRKQFMVSWILPKNELQKGSQCSFCKKIDSLLY